MMLAAGLAGELFSVPDRPPISTGGMVILGTLGLVTKIILAKIKQATDLAKIAAEKAAVGLEEVKEVAQEGRDEAKKAKELSSSTGDGFATSIITMIQGNHIELMGSMGRLERRQRRLEERVDVLEQKDSP